MPRPNTRMNANPSHKRTADSQVKERFVHPTPHSSTVTSTTNGRGQKRNISRPSTPYNKNSNANKTATANRCGVLRNKEFLLDIMKPTVMKTLTSKIHHLGGTVVPYFSDRKPPFLVVSDHPIAAKLQSPNARAGALKPEVLKKMQKMPLLIKEAVKHNIKIRFVDSFIQKLRDLEQTADDQQNNVKLEEDEEEEVPRRLQEPFIRFDDMSGIFAPTFKEMGENQCSHLCIGEYYGVSLFSKATPDQLPRRKAEIDMEAKGLFAYNENEPQPPRVNLVLHKDGFCEICTKHCSDIRAHYNGNMHMSAISQNGFYDELDALIGSYTPNIECGKRLLTRPYEYVEDESEILAAQYEYSEGQMTPVPTTQGD